MTVRLLFLLLIVALIAGCGSSEEATDEDARLQAAERERQLAAETDKLLEATGGIEDLERELPPEQPQREPEQGSAAAPAGDDQGPMRNWTDPSGKVLATAEFVSLMDGNVCLQEEDGGAAVIPLDQLCRADQDYVKKLAPEDLAAGGRRGGRGRGVVGKRRHRTGRRAGCPSRSGASRLRGGHAPEGRDPVRL